MRRLALKPAGRPQSEINITPLVDVVLVLLIIFMVVTPLLEKDIGVRVPNVEQAPDTSEIPPDQLVVNVDAEGLLSINREKVPRPEYVDRLRAILARKPLNDKVVFMVADERTSYGLLLNVIDGAKQAGAEVIGMATEMPADLEGTPAPAPAPAPP